MPGCIWIAALVLAAAVGGPRQEPPPATTSAPTEQARLAQQIALIEDSRNPIDTRRAIARELLLQQWPDTAHRLVIVLGGTNTQAKIAVAGALADVPEFVSADFANALVSLLGDADAEVRQAAGLALASRPSVDLIKRLAAAAGDVASPATARLGAISALGNFVQREAVDALAALIDDPDPAISAAAVRALQRAVAVDVGDAAAARAWWGQTQSLSNQAWYEQQVDRLVRKDRDARAQRDALEARLVRTLESSFGRAADAERGAQLQDLLADPLAAVRRVGLRLVRKHLDEGKPPDSLPREVLARVRELMSAANDGERAAAVQAVAAQRLPEDAALFLEMLEQSASRETQLALINGLGYVGNGAATAPLLARLPKADVGVATEIVATLGRLLERDQVQGAARDEVADALQRAFNEIPASQEAARERILWGMGRMRDARFAPAFAAALEHSEGVAVRQQAARNIAALSDPALADALTPAVSDPDVIVRRIAVEALGALGSSEKHLEALWSRLASPPENDDEIRQSAWRGAVSILVTRGIGDVEPWLERIPGDARARSQRSAEVLQRMLRTAEAGPSPTTMPATRIRCRLVSLLARSGQVEEALTEFERVLHNSTTPDAAAARAAACDLLKSSLAAQRYDERVSIALAAVKLADEPDRYARIIQSEVAAAMKDHDVHYADYVLEAVSRWPPGGWTDEARTALDGLNEQVRGARETVAPAKPASQPAPPA